MAAKTLKNPYRLQTVTFKEEGGENQNTERKLNQKLRIQWL